MLTETQPVGFPDGKDARGTVNGVVTGVVSDNDTFNQIAMSVPGSQALNYNFAERAKTGGSLSSGQSAGIGFWQNKHGQALIRSLNGGTTATQLGRWLAATFPNMYGIGSIDGNVAGMSNAQIADLYTTLFKRNGNNSPGGPPKLDAQVFATALAVYVTNQTLAGTAAISYGFNVSVNGIGASTFNVGSNGSAFGVADDSELTVLDILLATDARTKSSLLFDLDGSGTISELERVLRSQANDLFSKINELGAL